MTKDLIKHGVIGGRGAAIKAGAPVDDGNEIDLYLKAEGVDRLLQKYGGIPSVEGANAVIHVVPDKVWPFDPAAEFASSWVAWLDLADSEDRAADALLDRLVGGRIRD